MTPEQHRQAEAEERAELDALTGFPVEIAMFDHTEVIAKAAAFLYKSSQAYKTGDPDRDLTPEQSMAFLHMAEHLMVYIGLFPEDWKFVAAPDDTADKAGGN